MMLRRLLWVAALLPAVAFAAGSFTVYALPAGAGDPASGKAPRGAIQSRADFGKPGYGGPCPPKGDRPHRYIFTIRALKADPIDADQDRAGRWPAS
jgi:phosphatidylethanolamine-binding protein (PEBP) family uncharacterized protein